MLIFINWKSCLVWLISPLHLPKNLCFYNSPLKCTAVTSDSLRRTHLAAHAWVGTWNTLVWKPSSSSRSATSHLPLHPGSSESRAEEANGDSVVRGRSGGVNGLEKESGNNSWSMGRTLVRWGYKSWAMSASAGGSQKIHGQTVIRTALRQIQAISLARH